jgi:TolB protein
MLSMSSGGRIRLEASLRQGEGGHPIFRKIYTTTETLFDRMLLSLTNDLSIQVNGRVTPALSQFLVVKEIRPGVSEVFMTDVVGVKIEQLTRHGSLTVSPTGLRAGRFAYITYLAGPPQIWGFDLEERQPKRLYRSPRSGSLVSHPELSPDGRTIAFVESNSRGLQCIQLLDWETGSVRSLTGFSTFNSEPAWSQDGERIAYVHGSGYRDHIVVVLRDGSLVKDISLAHQSIRDPSWAPDDRSLTFVATPEEGSNSLKMLDLASGEARTLCSAPEVMANPRWDPHGLWLTYNEQGKGTRLLDVATGTIRPFLENIQSHHSLRWNW